MIVNIDAGRLFDPLADYLEKSGLPVFRRCDRAVSFMKNWWLFKELCPGG